MCASSYMYVCYDLENCLTDYAKISEKFYIGPGVFRLFGSGGDT